MKRFTLLKKRGLFLKIGLMVLLLLIIGIGTITMVAIREQTKTIKAELIEKNKSISTHLASSAKNAFWSLNWLFVERQMKEETDSEDIIFLAIIKPNGEAYMSSGDKEYGENLLSAKVILPESQIVKDVTYSKSGETTKLIITPIKIGNEQWSLLMAFSLKQVEDARQAILKTNIGYGSVIFFLGMLLSSLFSRGMYRRINKLMQGIEEIAKGNLDYKISEMGRDELGNLATSFNKMTEDLKKTTTSRDLLAKEMAERKRTQQVLRERTEALERSNRDLEEFAYIASHDLQEPLRMVASYTQLLARRYKGKLDSDADEFIAYAVDGATRMKALINDLLSYSRVGTKGKDFEPTDCEAVFDRTLDNLQKAVEESGAKLTHDSLPTVMADDMQLGQLFQNLIGNAVKFQSEEPPSIHMSCERIEESAIPGPDLITSDTVKVREAWRNSRSKSITAKPSRARAGRNRQSAMNKGWVFSVRDNGIGIDPEFTGRIFIIFQRLHKRGEYPGTGIGLAICKKIVERHGGRIWVESQSGKGSTFYFTIPRREEK